MSGREDSAEVQISEPVREPVSARRAVVDVLVQLLAQVGNLALGLVVTGLIARRLGADGFGQWTTILSIVSVFGNLADLKLRDIAVREIGREPELEAQWLGALITLRFTLGLPVLGLAATALMLLSRGSTMRVAALVVSLTLVIDALLVLSVVFRLRVRNDLTSAFLSFNSLIWGACVIAISLAGAGMVTLAVAFTGTTLIWALVQGAFARRRARIEFRGARRYWRPLLQAGGAVGLAGLLTLAYARIDQIIVFAVAPHHSDAGLYGGVTRIIDSALFLPGAVMTTLFP